MKKNYLLLTAMLIPFKLFALDCYFAVIKNSCWENYEVVVDILKPDDKTSVMFSIKVPKDQKWARVKRECSPGERFYSRGQFFPVFWDSEKGKYYYAKNYWALPKDIKEGTAAWNIPVCFPDAFSGAPLPPDAKGNCKCDTKQIPPLELKK